MSIRLDEFEEVTPILRAGVYALVKAGVVIYVGKSKSLYQRIYAHRTTANAKARGKSIPSWLPAKGFVFDQVFVRTCTVDELDKLEAEMINLYKPRYNESLKRAGKVTAEVKIKIGNAIIPLNAKGDKIERRI